MKKNYYLYSLLLLFPLFSSGQISLNASMAPATNTAMIYYDANVPSPAFTFGKSGISNTWDFSVIAAVPGADDTLSIVPPASVPGGGAFPTATHCTYEGFDGSRDMMHVDAGGVTLLGFMGDPIGTGSLMPVLANPPVVTMSFPYTYGSGGTGSTTIQIITTGAAIGQPAYDSVRYRSALSAIVDVIAAGNMILPSGSYPSLLERRINTTIDSAWVKGILTGNQWSLVPGFPQTTTDSSFYWYSNQNLLHYAHALYDDTGLHDVHYYKNTISITGLNEHEIPGTALAAYPNPVAGSFDLKGLNPQGIRQWNIYAVDGQEVLRGQTLQGPINVQTLAPGSYILSVTGMDGRLQQLKFIKD
ncbi:MAG: T9SS type A sorting domain-containing protein [Bacteroidia bacterium]|nr:T9SS type A sorting domain-containing protein [Bacteroidia bacterium]